MESNFALSRKFREFPDKVTVDLISFCRLAILQIKKSKGSTEVLSLAR